MDSKRIFDIIFSGIGLLVLFPFFVVISAIIKGSSRGSIFFKQQRVGLYGRIFFICKFRTMVMNAESKGLKITTSEDGRVTKIGRILRKSKLDELPQLINVLFGDMSLVGPRPEVPEYVELYPLELKRVVLSVRPGITDWASIKMIDEGKILAESIDPVSVYINEIIPKKLDHAVHYVNNHSIKQDIIIIFITLIKILTR